MSPRNSDAASENAEALNRHQGQTALDLRTSAEPMSRVAAPLPLICREWYRDRSSGSRSETRRWTHTEIRSYEWLSLRRLAEIARRAEAFSVRSRRHRTMNGHVCAREDFGHAFKDTRHQRPGGSREHQKNQQSRSQQLCLPPEASHRQQRENRSCRSYSECRPC